MKTILKKYGILAIMSVLAVVLSFTACQQTTGGTGNKTGDGANLGGQMFTSVVFDSAQATFVNLGEIVVPYTLKDKTVTFDFSAVKKVYADKSAEAIVFMYLEGQVSSMEKDLNGGHMHPDKQESTREIITKYKDKITSKEKAIAFITEHRKIWNNSTSQTAEDEYNQKVENATALKPKVAEWLAGSTNVTATLSDAGDKLTFTSLLVRGGSGYEVKSNYEVAKGQGGGQ